MSLQNILNNIEMITRPPKVLVNELFHQKYQHKIKFILHWLNIKTVQLKLA
jgi:hypothetical protein